MINDEADEFASEPEDQACILKGHHPMLTEDDHSLSTSVQRQQEVNMAY